LFRIHRYPKICTFIRVLIVKSYTGCLPSRYSPKILGP
jgi:hypothetical protein